MNIKDLQPGSYTVVQPKKMNIKDLQPGSYSVVSPIKKPDFKAEALKAKQESDKANSFGGIIENMNENPVLKSAGNFGIGVGSALGQFGSGVGELALRAVGAKKTADAFGKISKDIYKTPFEKQLQTGSGQAGTAVGGIIPYFAGAGLTTIPKALSVKTVLPYALKSGLVDTGINLAQTGGKDMESAGVTGVTSALASSIVPGGSITRRILSGSAGGYVGDVGSGLAGYRGEDRTGGKAFIPGLGTAIGTTMGGVNAYGYSKTPEFQKQKQVEISKQIDKLEETYTDIASGTTLGKKKIAKLEQKTEALNRAGTEGKTPMRTLAEDGIFPERAGTKINSFDKAQQYKEKISPLKEANKKALQETGLSTQPIKLNDLEVEAIAYAKTPENINAGRFEKMSADITDEFDALRRAYPTGEIPLTVVDDIKSARWDNVFKNKSLIEADVLKKDSEYAIAKALQKNIEKTVEGAGNPQVAQLNREIGDRLEAAKFLEDLNGKTLKGGRLLKYVTTMLGATMGGNWVTRIIGAVGGNAVGDLMIATNLGSPKMRFILKNLKAKDPEAYTKTIQWLEQQKGIRKGMLMLPTPKSGNIINGGRPIPVLPKGEDTSFSRSNQLRPYVDENVIAQSKSPTREQTTKAINADISKPISDTIPQPKNKSKTFQTGEAIKKR